MRHVRLAAAARRDLKAISTQSELVWGKQQRERYLSTIRIRFDQLCEYPELGSVLGESYPGLRCVSAGRHMIFYISDETRVLIVRILHDAMDVSRHLWRRPHDD